MRNHDGICPGIDVLLANPAKWLGKSRVGLLCHPASVTASGVPTALALREKGVRVAALFGPEHGFNGIGGAGESVSTERHTSWRIPVFSLYGSSRRPTTDMLKSIDTIVCDLQDLGARPYTYVSTLRYILEAAATHGKRIVVTDRPIPLPHLPDGPMPEPAFMSFVAAVPSPMMYAMTPGEAALWLRDMLRLDVQLEVCRLRPSERASWRYPGWLQWIPPSPGIPSWESAMCYTATVFAESLPEVDVGRGTNMSFRVFAAPSIDARRVIRRLASADLPGIEFHEWRYRAARPPNANSIMNGVRLQVTDPRRFRPILTSLHILSILRQTRCTRRIWSSREARPEFFDKLYGTDATRLAMDAGTSPAMIAAGWRQDLIRFGDARKRHLLYD